MTKSSTSTKRRWIRPLPERLINKIAAGEVIERPAAVVKELVENALDAGSSRIEVAVEKGGSKRIRIVDNGCGIPAEQVEIAFSRHATSKIAGFDDLEHLTSYGFRGEALPSIASVSRTRMVTACEDADSGTEIVVEGGVTLSVKPISSATGTVVEVENLFFNTPARRKFLKAESTETRHISRILTALAIARCDVGFRYRLNEREVFALSPGQNLAERVSALLGSKGKMLAVEGEEGCVRVHGMVSHPDVVQSNRNGQYLFVNGRFVFSPSLSHAFAAAYGDLLPRGNFPVGALHIAVDPALVDVNVHPAKTEVRLSCEREVHDAVRHIVRSSLRTLGVVPLLDPSAAKGEKYLRATNPDPGISVRSRRLVQNNYQLLADLYRPTADRSSELGAMVTVDTNTGEIIGEPPALDSSEPEQRPEAAPASTAEGLPALRLVGRYGDLFLLFEHEGQLLIVDQHTAHERVLFEQVLAQMDTQSVVGQQLLLSVTVDLSPEQLAVFEASEAILNASGFGLASFGGRTVKIEAVPAILARKSPERVLLKMLDDIEALKATGYDLKKSIAQSMACRAAVMAGDRLSDREAVGLVEALLCCENMLSCPHGRPTFIKITRDDLYRHFGRV